MKALFRIVLVVSPMPPNKRFEFGEKLLDGVQLRRIRRQIYQFYSRVQTQWFYAVRMME
jgi:hypothetical protein